MQAIDTEMDLSMSINLKDIIAGAYKYKITTQDNTYSLQKNQNGDYLLLVNGKEVYATFNDGRTSKEPLVITLPKFTTTVDYNGNDGGVTITAVSEGNTNIKFYTNSGHLIKSIPVNVYNKFEYSPLECIEFTYPTVSQFGTSDWITPIIKTSQTNLTTGKTNIKTYRNIYFNKRKKYQESPKFIDTVDF